LLIINAQATPGVDIFQAYTRALHLVRQLDQESHRLSERGQVGDLRANVRGQTHWLQPGMGRGEVEHGHRTLPRHTELVTV